MRISAAEAAKITAERAEQARLDMLRRQQEAAERRARARRQNAILASGACVVLLAGILGTAFVVVDMTPAPADRVAMPKGAVAPLSADTEAFIATRKAVVRFAESPRNQCRQVDFNNESGMFSNEVRVRCNDDVPQTAAQARSAEAAMRFDSIRGTFVK